MELEFEIHRIKGLLSMHFLTSAMLIGIKIKSCFGIGCQHSPVMNGPEVEVPFTAQKPHYPMV